MVRQAGHLADDRFGELFRLVEMICLGMLVLSFKKKILPKGAG